MSKIPIIVVAIISSVCEKIIPSTVGNAIGSCRVYVNAEMKLIDCNLVARGRPFVEMKPAFPRVPPENLIELSRGNDGARINP